MFGNPEIYATVFSHSWEVKQFLSGKSDRCTLTPAILNLDYTPETAPLYMQVAYTGLRSQTKKTMRTLASEVASDGDKAIKPPSSLPWVLQSAPLRVILGAGDGSSPEDHFFLPS